MAKAVAGSGVDGGRRCSLGPGSPAFAAIALHRAFKDPVVISTSLAPPARKAWRRSAKILAAATSNHQTIAERRRSATLSAARLGMAARQAESASEIRKNDPIQRATRWRAGGETAPKA